MADGARHVAAVVLAAGASTRLGEAKQLLEFRGTPFVRLAADAAGRAGADPVIVVVGARAAEVVRSLGLLPRVVVETNDHWQRGLASSLAAGVRAAMRGEAACEGVLVMTADQPLVDAAALAMLLEAFHDGARLVAAEYSETIGVPAVIGREHWSSLLELSGDAGAGRWLRSKGAEVRRVPMPHAAIDIDSADDVARLDVRILGGMSASE